MSLLMARARNCPSAKTFTWVHRFILKERPRGDITELTQAHFTQAVEKLFTLHFKEKGDISLLSNFLGMLQTVIWRLYLALLYKIYPAYSVNHMHNRNQSRSIA